ncbi:MATE family efflux transporter [Parasedimentitalea huanghaiensis]|uniref:MATE family efflux transporter n=1 Tax=Parasedimentitalea huanghaiensis TaxID=2682100 RepID=A0A6L6WN99_9RHOB|nr:MATE family efflux transporter [Zongyanglinia huanghaiensis]MVO17487.1 MATE family efflux transporter [Zongyanglinia huanghaiensis]
MTQTRPEPVLGHRRVLKIALPIVLSNATVPILGAVDTGVVGQMGAAAPIGAVGLGAIILGALYWMFGFLRMGTTGLAAQALGKGDHGEVAALLTRGLMIAAAAGLALILLQLPLIWMAFHFAPASPEVEGMARDYLQIRIWSAPAAIGLFAINGWLIAQERTGAVLVLQLWMNGINIVLDLWFVLGLGWGVSGVAVATLLAETSGLMLGLWLCRAIFRLPDWCNWAQVFDRARLRTMALVNRDILIRSLLLEAIVVSFMFFGAGFGDEVLAANQVLLQFLMITAYGMDGFAFAAETLVGQAMGARKRAALRSSAQLAGLWGLGLGLLTALGFAVFGGWIIDLMTTADLVRSEARAYLPWMVAMPLLSAAAWIFDGIFIGATATRDMRNMMLVSFAVYVVAVVTLVPMLGNHGLWLALMISFVARGISLGLRYPALEARAA